MNEKIKTAMTILRRQQVEAATGLSRSTIYQRIKEKKFPPAVHLGPRAVGWRAGDIDAWLNNPTNYSAEEKE